MACSRWRARAAFACNSTPASPPSNRSEDGWTIGTTRGPVQASRVILATGGLSVPATGSDGTGLHVAAALGHRMVPTYPALTPLLGGSDPAHEHAFLAGVSLTVRLRAKVGAKVTETTGGFLFTHRGYSGPAVLDISHVVTRPVPDSRFSTPDSRPALSGVEGLPTPVVIRAQWSPLDAAAWSRAFEAPAASVATILARHLPARLAEHLMGEAGVPLDRRTSDLRRTERLALVDRLTAYVLPWTGDEGYKKAEVTGGGVALDEVDPRTLESRRCAGLFLCGELLDAFGPIGGHNFAWAWATGRAAGLGAIMNVPPGR